MLVSGCVMSYDLKSRDRANARAARGSAGSGQTLQRVLGR